MNSQVFREYDIRGIVADDFDDEFVVDLGRGYATLLHQAGKKTVTLGRDCRLSSDRLRDRLAEGLLTGAGGRFDVRDLARGGRGRFEFEFHVDPVVGRVVGVGGEGAGGAEAEEAAGAAAGAGVEASMAAPHLLQNRVPGVILAPQELQNAMGHLHKNADIAGRREYTAD